ncbi:Phosphoethanolamine N-methyltransferase [Armadillidium vulgare]|nr:Phosphoethanolamine N-methyltransferase [Armadillidium vulgare]
MWNFGVKRHFKVSLLISLFKRTNNELEFCLRLDLKPGQKILDIGCGTGGSAFYLARQYGCLVKGVDLSSNMISIANDRLRREEKIIQDRVSFEIGDILKVRYPDEEFNRHNFTHIRKGGTLQKDIGYFLTTVNEYGDIIQKAGFSQVNSYDLSQKFLSILEDELKYFLPSKEAFVADFSEDDFHYIVDGWNSKIKRVKSGDQAWGLFVARK